MSHRIEVTVSDATEEYLTRCARIRNLNRTTLVRRVLDVIASDLLVASILDDEDDLRKHRVGERRFKDEAA